jgi:hypothetical protein
MGGHGAKVQYRRGKMTARGAELYAIRLWSRGSAIGQVRWRRRRTPRFWVGICFDDGRAPETKGTSNVDWEAAFAIAEGKLQ